jgi:hypothetical protein
LDAKKSDLTTKTGAPKLPAVSLPGEGRFGTNP